MTKDYHKKSRINYEDIEYLINQPVEVLIVGGDLIKGTLVKVDLFHRDILIKEENKDKPRWIFGGIIDINPLPLNVPEILTSKIKDYKAKERI